MNSINKKNLFLGTTTFLSLILSTLLVHAALPSSLSAIEQTISQKDGVYLYDQGSGGGLYFTASNSTISDLSSTSNNTGIRTNNLDQVLLDESAIVKLYYSDDFKDTKIEIRYNERLEEIYCSYEYWLTANISYEEGKFKKESCESAMATSPLRSFLVLGETAYLLNLNGLCAMDDDGTGDDCARRWNEYLGSFSITEVGNDNLEVIPTIGE